MTNLNDSSEKQTLRAERAWLRWHDIQLEHLGYTVNLLLVFTIAALGSAFTLLKDANFGKAPCFGKCSWVLCAVSLTISGFAGLYCTYNRLMDFRNTARRARDRAHPNKEPFAPTREDVGNIGHRTWTLLHVQLWSFGVGILLLAFTIIITYRHNLAG